MFRVGYDDKPVVAAWLRYAMIHSMRVDRPDMFTEGEELDALDALRNALPKNPVYMKRQKALGEPLNEGLKEEARLREQPMELTKQQLSRVALYMAIGGVGSDVLWRGSEDFGDEELGEEEVRKFLRAGLSREYTMTLCMKDRELFSFSKAQESS
jgi:hypothetical protein